MVQQRKNQSFQSKNKSSLISSALDKKYSELLTKLGHPYDNAKIESFHSLLKREMIYQFRFPSIAHLILDVSKYIHWFNNERISLSNQKIKVA
ncbi:IS3 family transposase [Leuconostoc mesenteroides]|uniref:IS3 family transposase n=1 Tax=Leuconostoc mesenteroides TaxID=1245 RepID=UPI001301BB54|nr:IS3 family transposase [Leuconostoc mesenteroides]